MKIKICGVTDPKDAELAACLGAKLIGLVFSDKSKRRATISQAIEISCAARSNGATPVAVFVDEAADEIATICKQTSIQMIQLHGDGSRAHLHSLQNNFSVIYTVEVSPDGTFSQSLPDGVCLLFDSLKRGRPFDWKTFALPKTRDWILAGGLTPLNVAAAIQRLHPCGVDVASGVEYSGTIRKDPGLIAQFIQAATERSK